MSKRALITGIRGQDGAYLSELLLSKGYDVIGADRRSADVKGWRLRELGIENDLEVVFMDLLDPENIVRTVKRLQPDELYNLAAQSFVAASFEQPQLTAEINAMGALRLLDAVRTYSPHTRFYQASTSEMFGKARERPQREDTPFYPRSPYAFSKVFAHWATVNYREAHGMFSCCGMLFNHESPLRGEEFVTRKITSGVARIYYGLQERVVLGNLDASRDWGYAKDYVKGMWLMLNAEVPDDYVLATGESHTVREFVGAAFEVVGLRLEWRNEGVRMEGVDDNGVVRVQVSQELFRQAEVDAIVGDPTKARQRLGWHPEVAFPELIQLMVEADLRRVAEGREGLANGCRSHFST